MSIAKILRSLLAVQRVLQLRQLVLRLAAAGSSFSVDLCGPSPVQGLRNHTNEVSAG